MFDRSSAHTSKHPSANCHNDFFISMAQAMTCFEDLPPEERKRQREAMRRRLQQPGLRPGLIEKYAACGSQSAKFQFLKAFMLDPDHMGSIEIEAEFVSKAEHDDGSKWEQLPLQVLRKRFTTPVEVKFLEDQIVKKQDGLAHPQDPLNPEMMLYWVFKENTDETHNSSSVGTRTSVRGSVPKNKAAVGAVADALTGFAADFGKGKGAARQESTTKGRGKRGKTGEPAAKRPKAGHVLLSRSNKRRFYRLHLRYIINII